MTRLRDLSRPAGRVSERGSALITVILVALVLTVVGLGIAYFDMTAPSPADVAIAVSVLDYVTRKAGERAVQIELGS